MSGLLDEKGSIESLHAALLAADSATAVLESFFGAVTIRRRAVSPSPNDGLHERLRLLPDDELRHRAVWLLAGDKTLSQAELWYVANRLPAEQVQQLEESDTPFGRLMKPIGLKRTLLEARLCPPEDEHALTHRALLTAPSGLPVAEVYERYSRALFATS